MHKLIEFITEELSDLEKKAEKDHSLSHAEIQYGDMLAHFKKNLLKSEEMSNDGYSNYYDDMYVRDGDMSYSRGRGANAKRDSMGRYSSSYDRNDYSRNYSRDKDFMSELHELKDSAPNESVRREFQQFIDRIQSKM